MRFDSPNPKEALVTAFGEWMPSRRFLIVFVVAAGAAAAGAALLARSAASPELWAQCRSSDATVSIQGCTAIITLDHDSNFDLARAYNFRGLAHKQLGQVNEARGDFDSGIGMTSDFAPLFVNRARLRYASGDRDGAVADLTLAVKAAPGDLDSLYERGMLLAELGDWPGAERDFDDIIKSDPNSPLGHAGMGAYHVAMEDYSAAKLSLLNARILALRWGPSEMVEIVDRMLDNARLN